MHGTEAHINFDAPAVLCKWPSLQNQRRIDGSSPYLLLDRRRRDNAARATTAQSRRQKSRHSSWPIPRNCPAIE
jgi:hypothetical protein